MQGKTKVEIETELQNRGYTSVPGKGGGTVWTKPGSDGTTTAVRIDPPKPPTSKNYADEVPHVHKETVPTSQVVNGNYKNKKVTTYDDAGNPSKDPRATHIPGGH